MPLSGHNVTLQQVESYYDQGKQKVTYAGRNYKHALEGVQEDDYRRAFFSGELSKAAGSVQLAVLYWVHLIARVFLRRQGRSLRERMYIKARFEVKGCGALWDRRIQECLHASNLFLDYHKYSFVAEAQGLEVGDCIKAPPYTYLCAMAHISVHDISKRTTMAKDPKFDAFKRHFATLKEKPEQQADLLSIWITSRSDTTMTSYVGWTGREASANGPEVKKWWEDERCIMECLGTAEFRASHLTDFWKTQIPYRARDIGLNRERLESLTRGASAMLAIKDQGAFSLADAGRMFRRVNEEGERETGDWGSFKTQHALWNLMLVGWLRITDLDTLTDIEAVRHCISDRNTTLVVERFVCSTGVESDRKPSGRDWLDFFNVFDVEERTLTVMLETWRLVQTIPPPDVAVYLDDGHRGPTDQYSMSPEIAGSEDSPLGFFSFLCNLCMIEKVVVQQMSYSIRDLDRWLKEHGLARPKKKARTT